MRRPNWLKYFLKEEEHYFEETIIEFAFEEIIIEFLCKLNLDSYILNHLIQKWGGLSPFSLTISGDFQKERQREGFTH